jgi:transposase
MILGMHKVQGGHGQRRCGAVLSKPGAPALIGMEATGNCHWLVDLLGELGHELC